MSVELKSALFDEPDAADASAPPKRFKFAATFVIGVLILMSYAGKVLVIAHLDKRGGDARTYVKSSALVTDGPYAWSRNPTYALAMLQFLLWAALALYLLALGPWRWALAVAAIGLPALFFLVNDARVHWLPTNARRGGKFTHAAAGSARRPRFGRLRSGRGG